MARLILAALFLLCGAIMAVLATAFLLFAPTQYLSLDRADVPLQHLTSVREERQPHPDLSNPTQYLRVPGNCSIWFRTVFSQYPEVLRFKLAPPKAGVAVRHQVFLHAGAQEKLLFDSDTAPESDDGWEYAIDLPAQADPGALVLTTLSTDPEARSAWVNLRIDYAYQGICAIALLFLASGSALLIWWKKTTPAGRDRRKATVRLGVLGLTLFVGIVGMEWGIRKYPTILGQDAYLKLFYGSPRVPAAAVRFAQEEAMDLMEADGEHAEIVKRFKPNQKQQVFLKYGSLYVTGETVYRPGRIPIEGELLTDARGFSNRTTQSAPFVAVLGDSYCEYLPTDRQWPSLLSAEIGKSVCNFGIRAQGTIEERAVYEHVVSNLKPKIVILLFCETNDLLENERRREALNAGIGFETNRSAERKGILQTVLLRSHPISQTRRNTDRSLLLSGFAALSGSWAPLLADRSLFERPFYRESNALPIAGQYNRITFAHFARPHRAAFFFAEAARRAVDKTQLEQSQGWQIAKQELERLNDLVGQDGTRLVIVNLPLKLRTYLPLLEEAMEPEALQQYFDLATASRAPSIKLSAFKKNAENVSTLLSELCREREHPIPYLDLHPAFLEAARNGRHPYIEDDTHFNETGERVVAETIAGFLKDAAWLDDMREGE